MTSLIKSESHIMQLEKRKQKPTVENAFVSLQMYIMQIPILFLEYITSMSEELYAELSSMLSMDIRNKLCSSFLGNCKKCKKRTEVIINDKRCTK